MEAGDEVRRGAHRRAAGDGKDAVTAAVGLRLGLGVAASVAALAFAFASCGPDARTGSSANPPATEGDGSLSSSSGSRSDSGNGASSSDADGGSDAEVDGSPGSSRGPTPEAGGSCSYVKEPGTITISSISTAPSTEYRCPNNGQRIAFSFTPSGEDSASLPASFVGCPTTATSYGCMPSATGTLTIGAGEDPPNVCLSPLGVVVGAQFSAVRMLELQGTCTPVVFEPGISLSVCQALCSGD